jgi:putative hydrolase of the HAD superfamily
MVNGHQINREIRAYLFDYGGTLDTGGCHWGKVLWHAWQEVGVPVGEERFREAYVYAERAMARERIVLNDFTFRQTMEVKLRLELGCVGQLDYLPMLLDMVYEQTRQHTAHSREVLQQLAERCPLALVSNFYGNIHTVLREFGFDGLFQQVIESAVVGVRKPAPRIFLMGVEALQMCPDEVIVVGDSIAKDIVPAHQVGCQTIWLRGEQWDDTIVDETLPDRIIKDLSELL